MPTFADSIDADRRSSYREASRDSDDDDSRDTTPSLPTIPIPNLPSVSTPSSGGAGGITQSSLGSLFEGVAQPLRSVTDGLNGFGAALRQATDVLGALFESVSRIGKTPAEAGRAAAGSEPDPNANTRGAGGGSAASQNFNITQVYDPTESVNQLAFKFRQQMEAQQRSFSGRLASQADRVNASMFTAGALA